MSEYNTYGRCYQCGAAPGKPCVVIYGDGHQRPGEERREAHFYRDSRAIPANRCYVAPLTEIRARIG